MVLPGAVAAEEPFAFEYSGNFTDNRDADGKGTVRLNTSGQLVTSGKTVTVRVYILAGGGGAASNELGSYYKYYAGGGGGGNQTVEVELIPGTYEIIIGTGGTHNASVSGTAFYGGDGGATAAFGYTCTGGKGGLATSSSVTVGSGGSPNGEKGTASGTGSSTPAQGGYPNGGGKGAAGGDGYVELTFI